MSLSVFLAESHHLEDVLREIGVPFERVGSNSTDRFVEIRPPAEANGGSLVFFNRPDEATITTLSEGRFAVALVERSWGSERRERLIRLPASIFLVEHPRLVVGRLAARLFRDEPITPGLSPLSQVDPRARLHPTVSIGPFCVIDECEIGEGSVVRAHSVIASNVVIGKRVTIRDHCCVGGVGFGFARASDGRLERIPHLGTVVLEDDVELFPYVNVDRGTFGVTRIGAGTKVDHYSHVGHNTVIGRDTLVTAGVVLCGGSRVGDRVWLGVGSIVKEKVIVGDDVTTGLGAVVLRDVEAGTVVVGVPAKPITRTQ